MVVAPRAPSAVMDTPRAPHERPFFGSPLSKRFEFQQAVEYRFGFLKNPGGNPFSAQDFLLRVYSQSPFDIRFPTTTQCRMVCVAPLLSAAPIDAASGSLPRGVVAACPDRVVRWGC